MQTVCLKPKWTVACRMLPLDHNMKFDCADLLSGGRGGTPFADSLARRLSHEEHE